MKTICILYIFPQRQRHRPWVTFYLRRRYHTEIRENKHSASININMKRFIPGVPILTNVSITSATNYGRALHKFGVLSQMYIKELVWWFLCLLLHITCIHFSMSHPTVTNPVKVKRVFRRNPVFPCLLKRRIEAKSKAIVIFKNFIDNNSRCTNSSKLNILEKIVFLYGWHVRNIINKEKKGKKYLLSWTLFF